MEEAKNFMGDFDGTSIPHVVDRNSANPGASDHGIDRIFSSGMVHEDNESTESNPEIALNTASIVNDVRPILQKASALAKISEPKGQT